jgi:DNA-binding LytR/AlgR family response regulator
VYCESEVYQSGLRLIELEEVLSHAGFVRVSKSAILNVEKLRGVKNLANSKLEALLVNDERICVSRKYLKDIREVLLRRNG